MDLGKPLLLTSTLTAQEADCDCACPNSPFYLQVSNRSSTRFSTPSDTYTTGLPQSFHLVFSPFAPAGPAVLNDLAWRRYQAFQAQPQPLTRLLDYEFADQNLILPDDEKVVLTATDPEQLVVWLHVTNACNLDCPYCYVRKSSAQMDEATGIQVLDEVFKTAKKNGFKRVKLKYAGGEATLHFELVRLLHKRALYLSQCMNLELVEVMLSNGVIVSPNIADWLLESSVKLMISVDGIGASHDYQRPMKSGRATFDLLEKTLKTNLLPRGIKPDLSITITKSNACGIAEVVEWALSHDLPFALNFYRENALSASRQDLALEEQAIIEGMLLAYQVIEHNLPSRSVLNGLLDKVQSQAHTHTCGVGQTYAVVTHTGKLSQCQMHLDTPVSSVVKADTMLPLLANGPIRNLPVDEKADCRTCTYRYRCTGGCPLETYRVTGRWDLRSPNCNIYKTLYPQALRLEGLRLMKLHGYLP